MQKLLLFIILVLSNILIVPPGLFSQNTEQKLWLQQEASKQNNIIPVSAHSTIFHSKSKTTDDSPDDGFEIDHGDLQEANSSYYPAGGAYRNPHNIVASQMISAQNVQMTYPAPFLLTGNGVSILLIDRGRPRNDHIAFDQRVFVPLQDYIIYNNNTQKYETIHSSYPESTLHSTLCSGTMVSATNDNARGMAPEASVIAYDWDFAEFYLADYASRGINIVCIPWGYAAGWALNNGSWYWFGKDGDTESYLFGFYSNISKKWDDIIRHAPYLAVVKSAGNEDTQGSMIEAGISYGSWDVNTSQFISRIYNGTTPEPDGINGSDCLSDIAVSKNVITVGALSDQGTILNESSRGPTDDLRIKPDLVANGDQLTSTGNANNTLIISSGKGTSFATASVAGAIALLAEEQTRLYGKTKLLASTLKALLIHTAEDKGSAGPDCTYGWGIPNITSASVLMNDNYTNHRQIHEFTFTSDDQSVQFNIKKKAADIPLKVTVCWTDPAGVPPPISIDPTNKMLVNDIDLRVTRKSDNAVIMPWKLNPSDPSGPAITGDNESDNVEQIRINDNSTGDYIVKIYPKTGRLSQKQVVSVIISGNDVNANQNNITLENLTVNNSRLEEANTITCNNLVVETGGNLRLLANDIILKPGFKVTAGNYFKGMLLNNFYSVFEAEYPSIIFNNDLVWEDRDGNNKSIGMSGNNRDNDKPEINSGEQVFTYPNPSNGTFSIMIPGMAQLYFVGVYDAFGRVVFTKNNNFSLPQEIDISAYADGIYFIKIQTDSDLKLVKHFKKSL